MGAFNFRDLMQRIAALQIEAMLHYPGGAVEVAAFSYFFQPYQTYPYFTNRLGNIGVVSDSEQLDQTSIDVQMRLWVGKLSSGESGEREIEAQSWIGHLIWYFNEHELLQSKDYPDGAYDVDVARIVASTGIVVYQGVATETQEYGVDFTLRVTARNCIEQDDVGDNW